MITKNLIASLLVKDYDEAIGFYAEKLGFRVVEDVPMGDDRWVTIAPPNSQECVFALHVAKSEGRKARWYFPSSRIGYRRLPGRLSDAEGTRSEVPRRAGSAALRHWRNVGGSVWQQDLSQSRTDELGRKR